MLNNKYISTSMVITGTALLIGCATVDYGTPLDSSVVTIERQHSRVAYIGLVTVYQQKNGNLIRGEVQRKRFGRGAILGHVDIELLNSTGKTTYKDTVTYRRTSLHSRTAIFTAKLEKHIEEGNRLRITHHDSTHIR